MVPATGFEPVRFYSLEPESSASANSATRATLIISGLHKPLHFALDPMLDRGMHTTLGPYQARKPRVKPMIKNGFSMGDAPV